MAQEFLRPTAMGIDRTSFDAGLRAHMQSVFNYMAGGLLITGIVAFLVANTALASIIYGTPIKWLVVLAPLGFIMFLNVRASSMSAAGLKIAFWGFCVCMGLSMGILFLVFTADSVARAFFITAAMFGAMSLWGYTTKRSLAGMGAFFLMGIIGLLLAGFVNIFIHSSMVQWVTSVAGVLIFTGLAAYDTQRIKQNYSAGWGTEANDKLAVFGALSLYLNFINAFQYLLELTGALRRN